MRLPLLGDYLSLRRDPLKFYTGLHEQQGDIATFRMGPMDAVLVSDPELAKDILQRDLDRYRKGFGNDVLEPLIGGGLFLLEGDPWRPRRRVIQPLLKLDRLRSLLPQVQEQVSAGIEDWADASEQPISLFARIRPLVLRSMGTALLGTDAFADRELQEALNGLWVSTNARLWHVAKWLDRLPLRENIAFNRTFAKIRPVVREIRERALGPLIPELAEGGLDDASIDAEVITFLIAGQECTAIAAAWGLHLLAAHPRAMEALQAEIDAVDERPDFDTLWSLRALRGVIDESLRMYPPAWMVARQANEEHEVGGCPVPKDSVVLVCPYIIHRHRGHWERPEDFEPSRAAPKGAPHFMPFGTGPRTCVGANLARIIATAVVFDVARRYRLEAQSQPRPSPSLTFRPKAPLYTRVRTRS